MRLPINLKPFKLKSLFFSIILLGMYIFLTSIFVEIWSMRKNKSLAKAPVVLPYVVVHLDLKGTPLKLSYLGSLLPRLRTLGANSLLMEYEDMFPYEGRLVNLSAENCYNKSELKRFLHLAKDSGFEVIPLVQTFGHMEHVLKLAEFQQLREVPQHPDSICPSNPDTMVLIREMIQQVIQFHETVSPLKYIHIGCDEVFHLNKCGNCAKRNLSNVDIFLRHVRTLSAFVKSLDAQTTVLIWDDMLRGIKPTQWNEIGYFDNVQPVYWDYSPIINVRHVNLLMYHNKFKHIWIASAFKGADGRSATFPIINNRFYNVFDWMSFIQEYRFGGESGVYNFKGIILTGWSRYGHMDPPCELLPVAYPSLVINLLLVQKFMTGKVCGAKEIAVNSFIDEHLSKDLLECVKVNGHYNLTHCNFDGHNLYNALMKYSLFGPILSKDFDELGVGYFKYYLKVGMLNTNKVQHYIDAINFNLQARKEQENLITKEMRKYYEDDFVTEYVNQKMYYDKKMLHSTLRLLNDYLKVQNWLRRTENSSYFAQDENLIL